MSSSPSQSSLFILFVYACSIMLMVGAKPTFIVTRLVHYQSPQSPLFNPNATTLERSRDDLERSIARAGYLAQRMTTSAATMEAHISNHRLGFLVRMELGSRAVPQWLILDTGSPLTWIHCKPSEVPNVATPLFNPHESLSFHLDYCNNGDTCTNSAPVDIRCLPGVLCKYLVKYGTGSVSGTMGRDSLKFGDGILTDVTIGCTQSADILLMDVNGLLGLRWHNLSLLVQKRLKRFGYCIGKLNDRSNVSDMFLMGDGVMVLGMVTRLYVDVHYVVSVEAIRMGGIKLDIDPEILRVNHFDGSGGAIFDTGSTYTFLPKAAVENIEYGIHWQLQDFEFVEGRKFRGSYELKCYRGSVHTDLEHFPMVEIEFEGEGVLQLAPFNLFHQFDDDVFCTAFIPKETVLSDRSIIGIIMQQGFYFAFDIEGRRLGFTRLDCAKFEHFL